MSMPGTKTEHDESVFVRVGIKAERFANCFGIPAWLKPRQYFCWRVVEPHLAIVQPALHRGKSPDH